MLAYRVAVTLAWIGFCVYNSGLYGLVGGFGWFYLAYLITKESGR